MNMDPSNLKKTWVSVSAKLAVPECYFDQYVEIDMPYNDFMAFSEYQRACVVEAEMSKLGYVLENRDKLAFGIYGFVYSDTNLFESVEIVNEIVDWCSHKYQSITNRYYSLHEPWYIDEQLVEAVNRWKTHDIQEACMNPLRDLTEYKVKKIQEISMKLDAMLNENNDWFTKEELESEKELIDKVLERINEKLPIISM